MSEQPKEIRAFIALAIPEAIKAEIEHAQSELRRELPKHCARWINRAQFHLTLRFLGNVETSRIPELAAAVGAVCRSCPLLKLRAEHLGCFPDLRFPRVVWVGVHDEAQRLAALRRAITEAAVEFGERQGEKDFSGHVTMARMKEIQRPQAEILARRMQSMSGRFFGEWTADKVELMRSELLPDGARHLVVAAFGLKG